jgi:acylphosphatase
MSLRGVAQLVARLVRDQEVRGSSPRTPIFLYRLVIGIMCVRSIMWSTEGCVDLAFTAGPWACSARPGRVPLAHWTPHPDFFGGGVIARRRWRLDGRVQGVGFRAFCEAAANERNIRGWVRNEFDGSVSVEAEAESDVLGEFFRHLLSGHLPARVDRTEETPVSVKNDLSEGFAIR